MQESKHFGANYLIKFSVDFDEVWSTVETCWFYEPHTHFMWFDQYSSQRTLLNDFFFFFN